MLGKDRRRQIKPELAAFEVLAKRRGKAAIAVKPCNFVFVLVGHELEQIAHHRRGERCRTPGNFRFALPHLAHKRAIALGIGGILVAGQKGHAARNRLIERLRLRFLVAGAQNGFDRLPVMRGAAAPLECLEVHFHGRAIDADRFFDGGGGDRNQSLLIGKAESEQIGCDRIAKERGGDPRRIDHRNTTFPHP